MGNSTKQLRGRMNLPRRAFVLGAVGALTSGCNMMLADVPGTAISIFGLSPARCGATPAARNSFGEYGVFSSRLELRPQDCDHDGECNVIAPYWFDEGPMGESPGRRWQIQVPLASDGASIPNFATQLIGEHFTCSFLPAAIIHDSFCLSRHRPFLATHRAFHTMLKALGIEEWKTTVMYAAVLAAGPKWFKLEDEPEAPATDNCRDLIHADMSIDGSVIARQGQDEATRRAFIESMVEMIRDERRSVTLDDIDAMAEKAVPDCPFLPQRFKTVAPRSAFQQTC